MALRDDVPTHWDEKEGGQDRCALTFDMEWGFGNNEGAYGESMATVIYYGWRK